VNSKLLVGLIGSILAIIGSFLPWGTSLVLGKASSISGIQGAGIFTLILAVIGLILLVLTRKSRKAGIGVLIMGLLILVICAQQISMVKGAIAGREVPGVVEVNVGHGLYLTLAGGAILFIGGIITTVKYHKAEV